MYYKIYCNKKLLIKSVVGFTQHHFCANKSGAGFIALFSVIIISAALMLVAVSLSFSGFYARFNILDSELKAQANALADACVDVALLNLAGNSTFSGNATSSVGVDSCYIFPIATTTVQATIRTRAVVRNVHTYYRVVVDTTLTTLPVLSFEELPNSQ